MEEENMYDEDIYHEIIYESFYEHLYLFLEISAKFFDTMYGNIYEE